MARRWDARELGWWVDRRRYEQPEKKHTSMQRRPAPLAASSAARWSASCMPRPSSAPAGRMRPTSAAGFSDTLRRPRSAARIRGPQAREHRGRRPASATLSLPGSQLQLCRVDRMAAIAAPQLVQHRVGALDMGLNMSPLRDLVSPSYPFPGRRRLRSASSPFGPRQQGDYAEAASYEYPNACQTMEPFVPRLHAEYERDRALEKRVTSSDAAIASNKFSAGDAEKRFAPPKWSVVEIDVASVADLRIRSASRGLLEHERIAKLQRLLRMWERCHAKTETTADHERKYLQRTVKAQEQLKVITAEHETRGGEAEPHEESEDVHALNGFSFLAAKTFGLWILGGGDTSTLQEPARSTARQAMACVQEDVKRAFAAANETQEMPSPTTGEMGCIRMKLAEKIGRVEGQVGDAANFATMFARQVLRVVKDSGQPPMEVDANSVELSKLIAGLNWACDAAEVQMEMVGGEQDNAMKLLIALNAVSDLNAARKRFDAHYESRAEILGRVNSARKTAASIRELELRRRLLFLLIQVGSQHAFVEDGSDGGTLAVDGVPAVDHAMRNRSDDILENTSEKVDAHVEFESEYDHDLAPAHADELDNYDGIKKKKDFAVEHLQPTRDDSGNQTTSHVGGDRHADFDQEYPRVYQESADLRHNGSHEQREYENTWPSQPTSSPFAKSYEYDDEFEELDASSTQPTRQGPDDGTTGHESNDVEYSDHETTGHVSNDAEYSDHENSDLVRTEGENHHEGRESEDDGGGSLTEEANVYSCQESVELSRNKDENKYQGLVPRLSLPTWDESVEDEPI